MKKTIIKPLAIGLILLLSMAITPGTASFWCDCKGDQLYCKTDQGWRPVGQCPLSGKGPSGDQDKGSQTQMQPNCANCRPTLSNCEGAIDTRQCIRDTMSAGNCNWCASTPTVYGQGEESARYCYACVDTMRACANSQNDNAAKSCMKDARLSDACMKCTAGRGVGWSGGGWGKS